MEKVKNVYITTEGPANIDSPFNKQLEELKKIAIPKIKLPEEVPGTSEQLQQFYNSEQWKETREALEGVCKAIKEAIKPAIEAAVEAAVEVAKDIYDAIIKSYTIDPKVKKCYGIYKRTKKRKNKKKKKYTE